MAGAIKLGIAAMMGFPYSWIMEVHLAPELQAQFDQLVAEIGCAPEKLIEDALAWYVRDLAHLRETLDSRYDDLKSGGVTPIDGEAFFENLRKREEELLKKK
jgi:hypothetical protein